MLPSLQAPLSPSPGGFSRPQAGNGMLCRWSPGRPRLAGWLPSGNTERANPPSEPSRASSRLVQSSRKKASLGRLPGEWQCPGRNTSDWPCKRNCLREWRGVARGAERRAGAGGKIPPFPLPLGSGFLGQFLVGDYCPHFIEEETEAPKAMAISSRSQG